MTTDKDPTLPPLPVPDGAGVWGYMTPTSYTAEQMTAYGQASREQALTEAKSICPEYSMDARVDTKQRIGASHCATQIGVKLC